MFERYTESARRALFFARYEASHLGAISIEVEHILLGLIREHEGLVSQVLQLARASPADIRTEIESRAVFQQKIATSVEIPFTISTQRVLNFAAEEADRLLHTHIGPEHLLLGLLREESSAARSILTKHGLLLHDVRAAVVKLLAEQPPAPVSSTGAGHLITGQRRQTIDVSGQIDEIKLLVGHLAKMSAGSIEAIKLGETICRKLDELKRAFGR
jgi:ATP-dependent Clp protease ATP-binding subunit ClpC